LSRSAAALDARPVYVAPVRLGDLVDTVPGLDVATGDLGRDTVVTGLTLDSRTVRSGDLYAAVPGDLTHGARFVARAVASGSAAVLTDAAGAALVAEQGAAAAVPLVVTDSPRSVLGALAAAVYGRPAERLRTIGVTGTQGKTTVTYLLESALAACGRTPGLVGTTGSRANGRPVASRLTTPEAPDLHALLAVMGEQGVDTVALEVSSHALVQGRVDGVVVDVAVFLNLGRDHLDFHGDVDRYFAAKAVLFTSGRARRAVVDVGDAWGRRLAAETPLPTTTCTTREGVEADWVAEDVRLSTHGSDFAAYGPGGQRAEVRLPLPGSFNVRNALAATVALVEAGLPLDAVAAGLRRAGGVPGRTEVVDEGQDFLAVVDYAHKPDAVEAVLEALRPATGRRLLVVLGAGGDRDPGKRPLMGRVAARWADLLVVTDDNPRGEGPAAIRAALLAGVDRTAPHAEVVERGDRAAAIRYVVERADPGDVVIIAGKGHETGQEVAGTVHPFDDRDVLRAALRGRPHRGDPANTP